MSTPPLFPDAEQSAYDRLARLEEGTKPIVYGPVADHVFEAYGDTGPLVVFVHGGMFHPRVDRSYARPFARNLAEAGYRVWLVEYRRTKGKPADAAEDLKLFHDIVVRDTDALWVGHGSGATLVFLRAIASTTPLRVLGLAPLSDLGRGLEQNLGEGQLAEWLGTTDDPDIYRPFDPAMNWANATPSVWSLTTTVHGREDETVPVVYGKGVPGTVTVVDDAGHFDVVDPGSHVWKTVTAAVTAGVN